MKKTFFTIGIIFLILAAVLVLIGFHNRSMFYGIMDGDYSLYGKYGTYAKICFAAGAVSGLAGLICFVLGIKHKK